MAKLIYSIQASLDGYIEDSEGGFDFAFPTPEEHQFFNDMLRPAGLHLYGRRMYETMAAWETMEFEGEPEGFDDLKEQGIDFQKIWVSADKIVYSSTLEKVWTERTELRSEFDPNAVRELKESSDSDIVIAGATIAATAFAAGLIDEVRLTLFPVSVGAGKAALPMDQKINLELIDEHRFGSGAVHMHYRVA
jgi:dihydrofolate reductase